MTFSVLVSLPSVWARTVPDHVPFTSEGTCPLNPDLDPTTSVSGVVTRNVLYLKLHVFDNPLLGWSSNPLRLSYVRGVRAYTLSLCDRSPVLGGFVEAFYKTHLWRSGLPRHVFAT